MKHKTISKDPDSLFQFDFKIFSKISLHRNARAFYDNKRDKIYVDLRTFVNSDGTINFDELIWTLSHEVCHKNIFEIAGLEATHAFDGALIRQQYDYCGFLGRVIDKGIKYYKHLITMQLEIERLLKKI